MGLRLPKPVFPITGLRFLKPVAVINTDDESISCFVPPTISYPDPTQRRKVEQLLAGDNNELSEYMTELGVPIELQPGLMTLFHQAAELAIAGKPLPCLETTEGHQHQRELPSLPDGLTWPQNDFTKAEPEFGKHGERGLAHYLQRVWEPLIQYITMPMLRAHYPRLGEAIDRQRSTLPERLLPALKAEVVDRELNSHWVPTKDIGRLNRARRRRLVKARQQDAPRSN